MTPAETPNQVDEQPGGAVSVRSQHPAHEKKQLWAGKYGNLCSELFAHMFDPF